MGRKTPEQIKGLRFEIWLEKLFKDHYRSVRRNIMYYHDQYLRRQVDVEFKDYFLLNPLIIVEAKYRSSRNLSLNLRKSTKKSGQRIKRIESVLDELEERRLFVKARKAILVTNRDFEKRLYDSSEKYSRIILYNHDDLERLDKDRASLFSFLRQPQGIEDQIKKINLRHHSLKPLIDYV
jgi:hypothetical protein